MKSLGITKLPRRAKTSIIGFADNNSLLLLLFYGIVAYCFVILLATCIDLIAIQKGHQVLKQGTNYVTDFWGLVYFNAITILTVGYGDLTPEGIGRIVAVAEAIIGAILLGSIIGVVVVKLMLPRNNAIVFSKYCYFDESQKRFIVQFVNTMNMHLVNAEMCSLLKMGRGDWRVYPAFTAPYVGDSAWTFSVNSLSNYDKNYNPDIYPYNERPNNERPIDLSDIHIFPDDGIKFGISGSYGFATFSAAMKYSFKEVWVVPTKESLPLDTLRNSNFKSKDFTDAFHYKPSQAVSFEDYARQKGATVSEG